MNKIMISRQCKDCVELSTFNVPTKRILEVSEFFTILAIFDTFPISDRIFHIEHVKFSISHLISKMLAWMVASIAPIQDS